MKRIVILTHLIALLLCISLSPRILNAQGGGNYKTYGNGRYGYSISYPEDILVPQGESDNGDGQRFVSNDGSAVLLVYGSNNVLEQSLKAVYLEVVKRSPAARSTSTVTYKAVGKDWFVVSGHEGGRVFYQKTMLKGGVLKTFRIEYDDAQKQTFDPIVIRIAKSFKG
jgi:hypothetical protein